MMLNLTAFVTVSRGYIQDEAQVKIKKRKLEPTLS